MINHNVLKWFDMIKVSTMKIELKTKKLDLNHIKEAFFKHPHKQPSIFLLGESAMWIKSQNVQQKATLVSISIHQIL